PQGGVALAFEVKTRRPFEQANDGWAMEFLQEARRFLFDHGCQQVELPPETAEKQTSGIDDIDQLNPRVMREDDFVPAPVA
ncbi:MAG TPA: hypothetical protein VJ728_14810, partial [Candidatus Binataceae bacterium]|nr:hypothetical protein [Candidatus Binataceae bacterium]